MAIFFVKNIARCLDPAPLLFIIASIHHEVFIVSGRVKVGHTTILIVLNDFSLARPPWINIDPYLLLLALLLLLMLVMRHHSWEGGYSSVLSFKGAWQRNHDNPKTSTHHDCVVAEIGIKLILTVGVQVSS